LSPDAFARLKICQKCVCGQGSSPDPTGGAHSTPPDLLAGFGGLLCGREGRKWEGKGKDRKGEEVMGGEGPLRLRIPGSFYYPSSPLSNIVSVFILAFIKFHCMLSFGSEHTLQGNYKKIKD